MLFIIFSVILAYLAGAIPTAFIFGKVIKGIDIRQHGSGNVGATNAMRVIGRGPGMMVFLIDFLKGFAAVTFFPQIVNHFFRGNSIRARSFICC